MSKLEDGEHPSKALKAYEDKFKPFVLETQSIPFFIPGIAHPETAWQRWLFQSLVSTIAMIVKLPLFASKTGESNDNGFALPRYPALDGDIKAETNTAPGSEARWSLWELCKNGIMTLGRSKSRRDL